MITQRPSRSTPHFCSLLLACVLHACAGTEADNPVADNTNPVHATPCKGHEEYDPFALAELRGDVQPNLDSRWRLAATPAPQNPAMAFAQAGLGLTPISEFPIVTECADWAIVDDELALQFVNFSAGCGITWSGEARIVEPGVVALELKNADCVQAGCFECSYDARGRVHLQDVQAQKTLTLRLSLDDCNGAPQVSEWVIDMAEAAAGNRCKRSGYGFVGSRQVTEYQTDLYEICDPNDTSIEAISVDGICAEALTCSAGRCVPSCTSTEQCPLNGAFECVEGLCQLQK